MVTEFLEFREAGCGVKCAMRSGRAFCPDDICSGNSNDEKVMP
jgi:hypothetical protein